MKQTTLQGDEGSPLMCLTKGGSWELEGLLSHHSNCGTAKHPAIFTATRALNTWILNTIGMANGISTRATTSPSKALPLKQENVDTNAKKTSSSSDGDDGFKTAPISSENGDSKITSFSQSSTRNERSDNENKNKDNDDRGGVEEQPLPAALQLDPSSGSSSILAPTLSPGLNSQATSEDKSVVYNTEIKVPVDS